MRAAYFAALFAVFGFLIAPAGFMPALAADGGLVLQICPGTTPAARALMVHEAKAQSSHSHHNGHAMHTAHSAESSHTMQQNGEDASATGHPDSKGHAAAGDSPCDYAVVGPAALPDQPIVSGRQIAIAIYPFAGRTPITGIFPAGLPPSTGPPNA